MTQNPILTITLNPAVDVAADVPVIKPNLKLRCAAPQFDPGGGGINVSRAIAKLAALLILASGESRTNGAFAGADIELVLLDHRFGVEA